jgi:hypothetical protein
MLHEALRVVQNVIQELGAFSLNYWRVFQGRTWMRERGKMLDQQFAIHPPFGMVTLAAIGGQARIPSKQGWRAAHDSRRG